MKSGMWSLLEAAARFEAFSKNIKYANEATLSEIAILVRDQAKAVIGTYTYDWQPLAESTLKKKSDDTPLLETGKLRDSISAKVIMHGETGSAYVGTDEMSGVYAELGTKSEPPRSFLLMSALHSHKDIGRIAKKNIRMAWISAGHSDMVNFLHAVRLLLDVVKQAYHATK